MKNNLILGFIFSIILCSCIEQKYILKDNCISIIKPYATTPIGTDSLYIYDIDTCFKSKIETKGDFLIVSKVPDNFISLKDSLKYGFNGGITGSKKDFKKKYYYPELDSLPNIRNFKYLDSKPILQGLSIPLKIRPALKGEAQLDSFPSQTETGFNPAIAFGWKFNYNVYSPHKDIFGKNLKQYSITPGLFLGTGAVDLKKSNTRNPIIKFERKAAIVSTGGFIMVGYNNINFGYSFGWDFATGKGKEGWLYQGKMWHGVSIGIDIIK